jgi:hypothetical protein
MPPYSPEVITGQETWFPVDFTTGQSNFADALSGVDTETIFGSITNDDFAANTGVTDPNAANLAVDLLSFGDGYALEWVDEIDGAPGLSEQGLELLSPFGDFPLSGLFLG